MILVVGSMNEHDGLESLADASSHPEFPGCRVVMEQCFGKETGVKKWGNKLALDPSS